MMSKMTLSSGKTVRFWSFRNEALARSWSERSGEWIVLGDVGQFWVCSPRDAARLERAGYEMA